ncbi:MAG: hypothetical protein H6738_00380 [Alphaproteobacteria bacterium]|nr:hypothetical protein [Alphaproteobacteria bacterium]MCB9695223.1 hypothetical protein [Alphaproteobacteria bacterium]
MLLVACGGAGGLFGFGAGALGRRVVAVLDRYGRGWAGLLGVPVALVGSWTVLLGIWGAFAIVQGRVMSLGRFWSAYAPPVSFAATVLLLPSVWVWVAMRRRGGRAAARIGFVLVVAAFVGPIGFLGALVGLSR